jgi:hypothetical protein
VSGFQEINAELSSLMGPLGDPDSDGGTTNHHMTAPRPARESLLSPAAPHTIPPSLHATAGASDLPARLQRIIEQHNSELESYIHILLKEHQTKLLSAIRSELSVHAYQSQRPSAADGSSLEFRELVTRK